MITVRSLYTKTDTRIGYKVILRNERRARNSMLSEEMSASIPEAREDLDRRYSKETSGMSACGDRRVEGLPTAMVHCGFPAERWDCVMAKGAQKDSRWQDSTRFGASVSNIPIFSKYESRLHQFGKKDASWNRHGKL